MTGTEQVPELVVTDLKTIPQIRSTQTEGVPLCVVGWLELVAHGTVIQSVAQFVPTTLPSAGDPPVMLKDIAGELTAKNSYKIPKIT